MLGSDSEGLSAQYHSEVRVLKPKGRFLTTRVESRVSSVKAATRNRKFRVAHKIMVLQERESIIADSNTE